MKIAHVITRSDAIGGAQVHVLNLAVALRKLGHDVVLMAGKHGPLARKAENRGLEYRGLQYLVRPIRPHLEPLAIVELLNVLRAVSPDLVALHSSKAGWIGRVSAKLAGIPSVFTVHGWSFTEGVPGPQRKLYRLVERVATPLADRIITVSEYDYQRALSLRVADHDKMVVIHNGVPDVPSSLYSRPEKEPVRIVMVARFDIPKDHALLLRALAPLHDRPWELVLIGDGPRRPAIERMARGLQISDRVSFIGECDAVAEQLGRAQVCVLTSNWEGLPLTIIEAMRAGLPVIASDVGGVREAVRDGVSGFLVPRAADALLTNRISTLLDSAALRKQMGLAGRKLYEERFTLKRMVKETLAVYENIMRIHTRTRQR